MKNSSNTKKNDDDDNIYETNNNKNCKFTHRRRQAIAIFQWNEKVTIAVILIFTMITYQCYQYYVHTFVYRPHYNYDNDALLLLTSRSQRFPTVHQRIQIYMSNWYIPSSSSFSNCQDFQENQHTIKSTTNWVYDYSPEYMSDGIKYHVLNHRHDQKMKPPPPVTVVANQVQIGTIFYTDIVQLHECYRNLSYSIRYYCRDMMESMLVTAPYSIPLSVLRFLCTYDALFYRVLIPFIDRINDKNKKSTLPIMVQFSDETESWIYSTSSSLSTSSMINLSNTNKSRNPKIPHIKKIRYALHKNDIDRIMSRTIHNDYSDPAAVSSDHKCHISSPPPPQLLTGMTELQPILWLLNENRHFKYTWDINRYDQSYSTKKNMSVFRGMLTGPDIDPLVDDYTNCMLLPRCRLVYQTYDSPYVDAKITDTLNKLPDTIHDRNITGTHLWKEDILSYKGIVILEGNDVSSGLKWAMVSNSVVLMSPNITYSSWMMEELLQPYVHYIPIDIENSRTDNKNNNIEAQTIWMLQHEAEVQRIIHRAKLWILDLYYHPDARRDRDAINAGILQQYQQYFSSSTTTVASLD